MADNEALINFPCDFPIKVMGLMRDDFSEIIVSAIQTLTPDFNAGKVEMRASSGGKYISLTCNITVTSRSQLDDIYRLLTSHPLVSVVL